MQPATFPFHRDPPPGLRGVNERRAEAGRATDSDSERQIRGTFQTVMKSGMRSKQKGLMALESNINYQY